MKQHSIEKKNLIAIYTRVSTDGQARDGWSLDAQETALRAEARRQGKKVFKVYREEGRSGGKLDRPILQQMLHDIRNGTVGAVWVWNISRISRNLADLLNLIDILHKAGTEFFSLEEQLDLTTTTGKFALNIMGGVAEMQRTVWRDASLEGKRRRVEEGLSMTKPIYGYDRIIDESIGKSVMIPNQEEAKIVKMMFDLYAKGSTLIDITKAISAAGYHGKKGCNRIDISPLRKLLSNPVYIGKFKYKGKIYQGRHEALVDETTWKKVQDRLNKKPMKEFRPDEYNYLLTGIIRCPECGSRMNGKAVYKCGNEYHYYRCNRYSRRLCHFNAVNAIKADTVVMKYVAKFLKQKMFRNKVIAIIRQRTEKHSENDYCRLYQMRDKCIAKKKDLLARYELGKIDLDEYRNKNVAYSEEINEIDCRIAEWDTEMDGTITDKEIMDAFTHMSDVLDMASKEEQKKLIKLLVSAVYVDDKRQVSEIQFRVPGTGANNEEIIKIKVKDG